MQLHHIPNPQGLIEARKQQIMKFEKDGPYFVSGEIIYLGTNTFNEKRTDYEQIELRTSTGELINLKRVTFDAETRRVADIGQKVTLYISVVANGGQVSGAEVWAARNDVSGRVFVRENLEEMRVALMLQIVYWSVLSPIGLLLFVIGMLGMLYYAYAFLRVLRTLPKKQQFADAVAHLRNWTPPVTVREEPEAVAV